MELMNWQIKAIAKAFEVRYDVPTKCKQQFYKGGRLLLMKVKNTLKKCVY